MPECHDPAIGSRLTPPRGARELFDADPSPPTGPWEALAPAQRQHYEALAEAEDARFWADLGPFVLGFPLRHHPKAPRRPVAPFFHFLGDLRPELEAQHPGAPTELHAAEVGRRWKELNADARQVYVDRWAEDKERYVEAALAFLIEDYNTADAIAPEEDDGDRVPPSRPLPALLVLCRELLPTLVAESPDASSLDRLRRALGRWRELPEATQAVYATAHEAAMAAYAAETEAYDDWAWTRARGDGGGDA